jgi:hypothetical protein
MSPPPAPHSNIICGKVTFQSAGIKQRRVELTSSLTLVQTWRLVITHMHQQTGEIFIAHTLSLSGENETSRKASPKMHRENVGRDLVVKSWGCGGVCMHWQDLCGLIFQPAWREAVFSLSYQDAQVRSRKRCGSQAWRLPAPKLQKWNQTFRTKSNGVMDDDGSFRHSLEEKWILTSTSSHMLKSTIDENENNKAPRS